ncbi:MAG TPA: hypothetical protein VF406_15550 [Thermodesulfobacteriota bacterium]
MAMLDDLYGGVLRHDGARRAAASVIHAATQATAGLRASRARAADALAARVRRLEVAVRTGRR